MRFNLIEVTQEGDIFLQTLVCAGYEIVDVGFKSVGVDCECKYGIIIKQYTLMQTKSITYFN